MNVTELETSNLVLEVTQRYINNHNQSTFLLRGKPELVIDNWKNNFYPIDEKSYESVFNDPYELRVTVSNDHEFLVEVVPYDMNEKQQDWDDIPF